MARRHYLGHDSPEGKDIVYRDKPAGYQCGARVGQVICTGGKNVVLGRLYNSVTRINGVAYYDWGSPEAIARKTVAGWMQRTAHRENILTPHWRHAGSGVEIGPDNQVLVTQNFC